VSAVNRNTSATNSSPLRDAMPHSVPEGGSRAPIPGPGPGARHLYVHLPFCAHRCGYCDFVTVVGRDRDHGAYVDALLAELALERGLLADPVDTVFLGGGTPTVTEPAALWPGIP
jgi:coproporphyrinogen III oxidase-like Fe-S oxidoreductase